MSINISLSILKQHDQLHHDHVINNDFLKFQIITREHSFSFSKSHVQNHNDTMQHTSNNKLRKLATNWIKVVNSQWFSYLPSNYS